MKKLMLLLTSFLIIVNTSLSFAATLDPNIPVPFNVTLTEDGTVSWSILKVSGVNYKRFQIRLLKRAMISSTSTYLYSSTSATIP